MKSPPPRHDLDAESSVLSAMILAEGAVESVIQVFREYEPFYSDSNARIYKAIRALYNDGRKIDVTTIAGWLRARDWFDAVGGVEYVIQIVNATPSVANVEDHAHTVLELYKLRRFQEEAHRSAALAYTDVGDDVYGFMSKRLETMAAIAEGESEQDGIMLGDLIKARFAAIQNPEQYETLVRVRTGINSLDRKMGILKGGDVLFIGAHSGVGKTSLAKNIAVHIASNPGRQCASLVEKNGEQTICGAMIFGSGAGTACDICGGEESIKVEHHVAFFSPEMTDEELHDSIVFSESKAQMPFVDFNGRTHITEEAFQKVGLKAVELAQLPIKIFTDSSVRYMSSVRLKCLAYKRKLERDMVCARCRSERAGRFQCSCGAYDWVKRVLAAFIVDYVQLMKPGGPDGKRAHSREQEVASVGRLVKELAKETSAVGIDLGQLNKDAKKEKRKPILDDIRESSSPGYDANKAILIYNPAANERVHEYADTSSKTEDMIDCVDLIIAKCRGGGRTGIVRCAFYPQWTLFSDWPEGCPMPDNEAPGGEEKNQRRR